MSRCCSAARARPPHVRPARGRRCRPGVAEDVELAPRARAGGHRGRDRHPRRFAGFVHPRSGLAHRLGLSLVNAPGTVDAGYRGEIRVNLVNLDPRAPSGSAAATGSPSSSSSRSCGPGSCRSPSCPAATAAAADTAPREARRLAAPSPQHWKGGSDMPFGRRSNRIDRSIRERGVPPEPQVREREETGTTRPLGRRGRPRGRAGPDRPRRAAVARDERDGAAGRRQPPAAGGRGEPAVGGVDAAAVGLRRPPRRWPVGRVRVELARGAERPGRIPEGGRGPVRHRARGHRC